MSKTFKALQRAAEEQARRLRREREPGQPAPPGSPPPSAALARQIALAGPPGSPAATPGAGLAPAGELRSEVDLALRDLLEGAFRPACPQLRIGDDGWVHGSLDREALRELRRRAALLHCLVKDPQTSFWFWGSAREAEALAKSTGYLLDPVD